MSTTNPEHVVTNHRPAQLATTAGRVAILLVALFLTLGPVVWTVFTALTPPGANGQRTLSLDAFRDVADKVDIVRLFWNSTLVTGL